MNNVYSANEFLTRVNLMKAHREEYATPINIAKSCVVIGGGNVAMDAARTALRLGSKVTIAYRRTEEEMPARNEEIQHAKEEGIEFNLLSNPIKIIGENKVKGIELIKMKLGEKVNGRKSVSQIEGTNFTLDCDQVIIAVGTTRNPLLKINIEYGKRGEIIVDGKQQTTQHKIFAGGDITSGTSTVITAMKDGKVAANAIDNYLR